MSDSPASAPRSPLSTGWKRCIFPATLGLTWIIWNVSIFHCSFLKAGYDDEKWQDLDETGIFTSPAYDADGDAYTCKAYDPDADIDAAVKSARFFGAMGFIFHTMALFIVLSVETCLAWRRVPLLWNIVLGLTVASFVCSVLIFSGFGTETCTDIDGVKCAPGGGGIVAIFNIFFIVGVIVLAWLTGPPSHPFFFCRRWAEENAPAEEIKEKYPEPMAPPEPIVSDPTLTEEPYHNSDEIPVVAAPVESDKKGNNKGSVMDV